MKYTAESTNQLLADFAAGQTPQEIASKLNVPPRSVIAKLSSLGVYTKKAYVNKRGEAPIKKEAYIERIAELLGVNLELMESLEKANKNVLILLEKALQPDEVQ